VRLLAVADCSTTTFRGVVGGFPGSVVQEGTEPTEMVVVQVLLLSTQWGQRTRLGVRLPGAIVLFGFLSSPPLPQVVLPDSKPGFEESTGYTQVMPDRTRQQLGQLLPFVDGQALGPMQEERAVAPQIFSGTTDLIPITPGPRRRLYLREEVWRAAQFSDGGRIGWRELEPLADGAVVDPELPPDRPS
jgi:hypothetical protein